VEHQIGEDLIVEKINQIFDEVARDRHDFEESYMSLSGIPGTAKKSSSKESDKIDVASTSIQVHEASLMGLDRTQLMMATKTSKQPAGQTASVPTDFVGAQQ